MNETAGVGCGMSRVRMIRSVSIGVVIGILALGLLPFLAVFSCAEMYGLADPVDLDQLIEHPLVFLGAIIKMKK
ncbi:hypothetical protein [Paenibacillus cymbidii]|uniref:hypothetical protein n=1 Tax=Paenibacillus cymbidii TaxID=1639034 RepID=UPI0010808485|nr:hypothetical protein [Paenibacillus cymbidii]